MSKFTNHRFTSTGTFTVPAGIKQLTIYGRGANTSSTDLQAHPLVAIPGQEYTVTLTSSSTVLSHGGTTDITFPSNSASTNSASNVLTVNASGVTSPQTINLQSNAPNKTFDVDISIANNTNSVTQATVITTGLTNDVSFSNNYNAIRNNSVITITEKSTSLNQIPIVFDSAQSGLIITFNQIDKNVVASGEVVVQWID